MMEEEQDDNVMTEAEVMEMYGRAAVAAACGDQQHAGQRRKYHLRDYAPGSPVIFETWGGSVVDGIYRRTQGNGMSMLLDSVSEFPSKTRSSRHVPVCYSAYEIKYLHVYETEDERNRFNEAYPALAGVSYAELLRMKALIWDSKYVPVYDHNFQQVVRDIQLSDVVGTVAVGSHSDKVRYARISMFVIATKNKIYLFDVMYTQKHFWEMGLKNILEDENIQKVLYDSKTVADLLLNRYGIKIANVFDVMVADYEIRKRAGQCGVSKFETLSALLQTYLHLPQSIFEYGELIMTGTTHKNRPIRDKMKRDLALRAAFLIALSETQAGLLLQTFHMASHAYSNLLVSRSDPCCEAHREEMLTALPYEVAKCLEAGDPDDP